MKHTSLAESVERAETLLATAAGSAQLAMEGSKDALKQWAALAAHFLRNQAGGSGPLEGFPEGYEDDDARGCLFYLVESLERIHDGEDPNKAFGWRRGKPGRPPRVITDRRRAAEDDGRLADVERFMEMKGLKLEAACEMVANHYNDDPDRLIRLAKRNKKKSQVHE